MKLFSRVKNAVKKLSFRVKSLIATSFLGAKAFAETSTGNQAGLDALDTVAGDIALYLPKVRAIIYAIAGVVALIGAISVYISMQNDEQDVKKKIMMTVGACIFLIAAATALPLFFGLSA